MENILLSETEKESNKRDDDAANCLYVDLIPAKASYFSQNFAMGAFVPYAPLFLVSIGFTVSQVGLIYSTRTMCAAIASLFIGLFVDFTGRKKMVMITLIILNSTFGIGTPFLPLFFIKASENLTVSYHSNNSITNILPSNSSSVNLATYEHSMIYYIYAWFIMLAVTGLPTLALNDSSVINIVKKYKGKASYGLQRICSPIGYTIGSFIAGVAIDLYQPSNGLSKYSIAYFILIPAFIAFLISVYFLNMEPTKHIEDKENIVTQQQSVLKCLLQNCKNFTFIMFLATLFITGVSFNIINGYLLLLLQEIGTSKSLMGIMVAMSTASEIVIYPFSFKLLRWFGGTYICICIGMFSYAVRFAVYYLCHNPWFILPAQFLHAFGHGLFWVACIEYTYSIASSRVLHSMFNLINTTFYMIGSVIANLVGGILFDVIGGRKLFMLLGIVCFCWGILMLLFFVLVERHRLKKVIDNELVPLESKA